MNKPATPHNETARLEALQSYEILDTLPEAAFDDLAFIAAAVCGTPVSGVSFIDSHRQVLKSRLGLAITETPRDMALCAHAILEPEQLTIVENARKDKRFFDHPAVLGEMRIVFYAGMPIVTSDNLALGTVCVMGHEEKSLSDMQKEVLKRLAKQAFQLLQLRKTARLQEQGVKDLPDITSFVRLASHELRAPLRSITSFIRLLEKKYPKMGDAASVRYLQFVSEGARSMDAMIIALGEYACISTSDNPIEKIDLNDLIEEMKYRFKAINGVALIRTEELPLIVANRDSIRQLFLQLFKNALLYQPENAIPFIEVSCADLGTEWRLCVSDNGIGIAPQFLVPVFGIFRRLHGAGDYPGTGVGLAICKKILTQLGGRIWAESPGAGGSRFYFTIPKLLK